MSKEWFKLSSVGKELVDMCPRSIHEWPKLGLRTITLPTGTRMTRREWVDEFLSRFEDLQERENAVDSVVSEICRDMGL